MSNRPVLDLEQFLPYRLSVLSNRISERIARLYAQRFNLGVTEWRIVAVLGLSPELSAGDVAQRTAMDKVAVSRAIASLIDAGRVEREVDDQDRRRAVLRLTPAGKEIYAGVVPLALAHERELLAPLDDAERQTLDTLLRRIAAPYGSNDNAD